MSETTTRLAAALADRYVFELELGAGGMATVYLAEDVKHKRRVAVKVLLGKMEPPPVVRTSYVYETRSPPAAAKVIVDPPRTAFLPVGPTVTGSTTRTVFVPVLKWPSVAVTVISPVKPDGAVKLPFKAIASVSVLVNS